MTRLPTIALLVSTLATGAAAQGAGIAVTIDRAEASLEDQLLLTVSVEGSQSAQPQLPELADFAVYSRGRSTQMQIINGRTSSSVVYNYVLVPKRAGRLDVGTASVEIEGRIYHSKPFTVTVHSTPQGTAQGPSRDVFITASLSKTEAYVSEQVVYTWRFFRRVRVTEASVEPSTFDGFVSEDLGKQRDYETVIDGQRYQVSELRKALFPQEAGTLTLQPAPLSVGVLTQQQRGRRGGLFGSPFDDFFGHAATQTKVLRAKPITVTVRALPPSPAGFSGLVGKFELTAQVSKQDVAVGESTTLTLTVAGEGNAYSIPEPSLSGLEGFKVYDDKPTGAVSTEGAQLTGSKSFRKALVPLQAGAIGVPTARLVYFDPAEGIYRTARTEPLMLTVRPGEAKEELRLTESIAPSTGKVAVKVLAEDIIPIHRRIDAVAKPLLSEGTPLRALAALLAPPLVFASFAASRRRKRNSESTARQRKRKSALKRGLAAADQARQAATAGDLGGSAQQVASALRDFLGDKLAFTGSAGALTPAEAATLGAGAGASDETAAQIRTLLERCEAAQYGAAPARAGASDSLPDILVTLLKRLDRELVTRR